MMGEVERRIRAREEQPLKSTRAGAARRPRGSAAMIRPLGRERRPACNHRTPGSRRSAQARSPGEPPGEHHHLGDRRPAGGRR
jgi:hypothetical protein